MRLPLLITIVFILANIGLDGFNSFLLGKRGHKKWAYFNEITAVTLFAMVVVSICLVMNNPTLRELTAAMWMFYAYATVYVPKWIYAAFRGIAYIPRLWHGRVAKFFLVIGAIASAAWCVVMWEGALIQRKLINVNKIEVEIKNLPDAFDGYHIVQFSDLHTGTYNGDTSFVSHLVDQINLLKPDAVFFTGDIINARSNELEPHVAVLSRLHAPDGVYSILGNHDYGDYAKWPSVQAKDENFKLLETLQHKMGWRLLRNETAYLNHGPDTMAIIGVENIGDPPFKTYGSLTSSHPALGDSTVKILLTHNPAHWVDSIANHPEFNIPFTLSGHTHAMQTEVFGFSPAKWRYKAWGGLYHDNDSTHSLYVNIGAGTVGFPARIGATPEITFITLRKKK